MKQSVLLITCTLILELLAACDMHNANDSMLFPYTNIKVKPFNAEAIACEDLSSPVFIKQVRWEGEKSNMGGKLFEEHVKYMRMLTTHLRKAADDGNREMMLMYGYSVRMYESIQLYEITELCSASSDNRRKNWMLPPETKNNVVTALSYAYIGIDFFQNLQKSEFSQSRLKDELEFEIFDIKIPPAWIAEAKANAAKWRKHCGKQ